MSWEYFLRGTPSGQLEAMLYFFAPWALMILIAALLPKRKGGGR